MSYSRYVWSCACVFVRAAGWVRVAFILVHFLSASFARRIVHERLGELEVLLWSVELSCTWPCNGRLEGLVG